MMPPSRRRRPEGGGDPVDEAYHARDESIPADCDLCVLADNRVFYIHHSTRSSHWEPPWASWHCRSGLPYGWEQALDSHGTVYFIDHVAGRTTYDDPRQGTAAGPPEGDRRVEIKRHPQVGYGFVAASQHPVLVQFVSPAGPSDGQLYANDQIFEVNGVDVRQESKERVVNLVRASTDSISLLVCQLPKPLKNGGTPGRRRCRVRFTDRVVVTEPDERTETSLPSIPNVMRVFLENGQTRAFKYDKSTCVQDVFDSVADRLQLRSRRHFALCVEYSLGARLSRLSLLRPELTLAQIANMPNSEHLRCLFRVAFIPMDPYALYLDDPKAFEYYYQQCVNDVVSGRFAFEMRYEACVRLAALHLQQLAIDTHTIKSDGRVSVKRMEFYLTRDNSKLALCVTKKKKKGADEQSQSSATTLCVDPSIAVRLKYVQIVSHLPTFGGRCFSVTFKDSQIDMIMQVDPRCGLLVRHPGKSQQPTISISFDLIERLHVLHDTDVLRLIVIRLRNNSHQGLEFLLDKDDIYDLVLYIQGYHRLLYGSDLPCDVTETPCSDAHSPPAYRSVHKVLPSGWNYAGVVGSTPQLVDFGADPPSYAIAAAVDETTDGPEAVLNSDAPSSSSSSRSGALPPPAKVDPAKRLVKAVDSFLTKSSRALKENASPMLVRRQTPTSTSTNGVSDSSDTEESSWSSPRRSPRLPIAKSQSSHAVRSFGLKSPDEEHHPNDLRALLETCSLNGETLESLLGVFPDKMCTDPEIVDLTGSTRPPSGLTSSVVTVLNGHGYVSPGGVAEESAEGGEEEEGRVKGGGGACRLPSSRTFPVETTTTMALDSDLEDFLRRSNSITDSSPIIDMASVKVRRMSLKEFTGLDPPAKNAAINTTVPDSWRQKGGASQLLDACSRRRRSLASNDSLPSGSHKLPTQTEEEPCGDFRRLHERLEAVRGRLAKAMEAVPSESPRRRTTEETQEEKLRLLDLATDLAAGCKALVRSASESGGTSEHRSEWLSEADEVVRAADAVTAHVEGILRRSASLFHAQLLTAKTEQMLKSLSETLNDAEKASAAAPFGEEAKQLVKTSTTLAATLTQLIQAVRSI